MPNAREASSTELPKEESLNNAVEAVRTAREMTENIRTQAQQLEKNYPGLDIQATLESAIREVEQRISQRIQEQEAERVQHLDLRTLWKESLEKHTNLLWIQQALENFAKQGKVFGEGEQSVSAQSLQEIVGQAVKACDASQEVFDQAIKQIPESLPFAGNIIDTLRRCRAEIQTLQKPNIIVDQILNSLDRLSQLGWEFPGETETQKLDVVKERIRRIQNDRFGNPKNLMDEIEQLPDYLHLRAKVFIDIQSRWDWVKRRLHPARPTLTEAVRQLDSSKTDTNRFTAV